MARNASHGEPYSTADVRAGMLEAAPQSPHRGAHRGGPARSRIAALALGALALGFASWGLWRLNTWYLASDQFAFLTLADDLSAGRLFHDDSALALIQPYGRPGVAYDALAQTYYWRDGFLYTRYPPGFPVLLVLARAVGGEVAQHALNPLLYLVTLVALGALTRGLLRNQPPALARAAAVTALWLFLLLPTRVHLWGITVARDLPAHLLGLLALWASARRFPVLAGGFLGLACTVRPDALLWATSVGAMFCVTRPSRARLLGALAALALTASPLLLYNFAVEGGPFRFTQGDEFREVLGGLSPAPATVASADVPAYSHPIRPGGGVPPLTASSLPSGGAFRLSHLRTTGPANAGYLAASFGWFLGIALGGLAWGWFHERLLVAAVVPYAIAAFIFYGCWSHPDARYLAGMATGLVSAVAVGTVVLSRAVTRAPPMARTIVFVGSVLLVIRGLFGEPPWLPAPGRAGTTLAAILGPLAVAGATRAARHLEDLAPLAPALAFAVLGIVLVVRSPGARDPFQRAEVATARETVARVMPPGSLVVTSTSLGRPAENLRHYSGVEAFYAEELPLLRINADQAMVRFLLDGRRVFYLLDARDRASLRRISESADVRMVERRAGRSLLGWYVDPRRAPSGAVLYELSLSDERARQIRQFLEAERRYRKSQEGARPGGTQVAPGAEAEARPSAG